MHRKAGQSGWEVPTYTWFLWQFWPFSCSASNMLHYTGRFKVKQMIQARPFRKINPDADYCNAIYDFMKQRTINHMTDSTFYSADAKCKVSVGEPDFPLAPEVKKKLWLEWTNHLEQLTTILVRYPSSLTPYLYKIFPSLRMRNGLMKTCMMTVKIHGSVGKSTMGWRIWWHKQILLGEE